MCGLGEAIVILVGDLEMLILRMGGEVLAWMASIVVQAPVPFVPCRCLPV